MAIDRMQNTLGISEFDSLVITSCCERLNLSLVKLKTQQNFDIEVPTNNRMLVPPESACLFSIAESYVLKMITPNSRFKKDKQEKV